MRSDGGKDIQSVKPASPVLHSELKSRVLPSLEENRRLPSTGFTKSIFEYFVWYGVQITSIPGYI